MIFFLLLRRDEFGEQMKKGKTSSEKWKLFQCHLKQFNVILLITFIFNEEKTNNSFNKLLKTKTDLTEVKTFFI